MVSGLNGIACQLYVGADYTTKKELIGQGDASLTHGGDPIEINNKSSGGWRVFLEDPNGNNFSTRSLDIAVSFTYMNDADQIKEFADAAKGITKSYIFDFGDYHYIGDFVPKISTESAAKNKAVTLEITYSSSGEIRKVITAK